MNEHELKKLLQDKQDPVIDQAAKKRAISLAMAEFNAAQSENKKKPNFSQALLNSLRLTFKSNTSREEKPMKKQPWAVGGLATAAASVFAFMIFVNDPPSSPFEESTASKGTSITEGGEKNIVPEVRSPELMMEQDYLEEELIVTSARQSLRDSADSRGAQANELTSPTAKRREKLNRTRLAAARQFDASAPDSPDENLINTVPSETRDNFETVDESPIKRVNEEPVSTFSVDVDTASYSFVRRQLNQGQLPQKASIRIEEMINYFDYAYPLPHERSIPFTTTTTVSDSPWSPGKKLLHIGIKGYEIAAGKQPKSNLVFLLDVSGSMNSADKLPLLKQSMHLLLSKLKPDDTVAIVVYAGAAGTVLEPTEVREKNKIIQALNQLNAGGSTAGAQGIQLAYQLAESHFDKEAVNRIILGTDGDFNVGITDREQLKGFIERKREAGIFLSVLGFGQGNYHDHLMQTLAQQGNGVAAYIDTLGEAQKVLVNEATSSLFPIAKDVKIQVEFNPATVSEYRLIGYETRALKREDFNNDKVDAGDIGAGHSVTAIYEFSTTDSNKQSIDKLRYSSSPQEETTETEKSQEYAQLKLRYKLPKEDTSQLIERIIPAKNSEFNNIQLKSEIEFSTAVAGFAQILKGDKHRGNWTYDDVINKAQKNKGPDAFGYRTEFVQLVRKAQIANEL